MLDVHETDVPYPVEPRVRVGLHDIAAESVTREHVEAGQRGAQRAGNAREHRLASQPHERVGLLGDEAPDEVGVVAPVVLRVRASGWWPDAARLHLGDHHAAQGASVVIVHIHHRDAANRRVGELRGEESRLVAVARGEPVAVRTGLAVQRSGGGRCHLHHVPRVVDLRRGQARAAVGVADHTDHGGISRKALGTVERHPCTRAKRAAHDAQPEWTAVAATRRVEGLDREPRGHDALVAEHHADLVGLPLPARRRGHAQHRDDDEGACASPQPHGHCHSSPLRGLSRPTRRTQYTEGGRGTLAAGSPSVEACRVVGRRVTGRETGGAGGIRFHA